MVNILYSGNDYTVPINGVRNEIEKDESGVVEMGYLQNMIE